MRATYRLWTAKELRRAEALYRAGRTHKEIARELGRTKVQVARQLYYRGCVRCRRHWLRDYAGRVRRLHAKGWSDRRIADRLGLCRETVRQWRVRLGLPRVKEPRTVTVARHQRALETLDAKCLADIRWDDHRIRKAQEAR
jgi:IS30 family transposase